MLIANHFPLFSGMYFDRLSVAHFASHFKHDFCIESLYLLHSRPTFLARFSQGSRRIFAKISYFLSFQTHLPCFKHASFVSNTRLHISHRTRPTFLARFSQGSRRIFAKISYFLSFQTHLPCFKHASFVSKTRPRISHSSRSTLLACISHKLSASLVSNTRPQSAIHVKRTASLKLRLALLKNAYR